MGFIFSLIVSLISFSIAFRGADLAGEKHRKQVKAIAMLIGSLMVLVAVTDLVNVIRSKFLIVVPAGHVGVVEEFGEVKDEVLKPGIHLMNPVVDVVKFSTRLKNVQEHIEATSREGLDIKVHVSLQYKLGYQLKPGQYVWVRDWTVV